MKNWIVGLAGLMLAGCAGDIGKDLARLVGAGDAPEAAAKGAATKPVYCYRTIGRVDCYPHPLPPEETGRLVSYFGPPPQALSGGAPPRP